MSNVPPASSPRSTFFSLSPAHSGALTQPSPPNSFSKDPFLVFESPPTKSMLRNASPKAFTPSGNAAAAPSNNSSESLSDGSTYESDDLQNAEGSPMKGSPKVFLQDDEASDSSIEECADVDLDPSMNIEAIFSGDGSCSDCAVSRQHFQVAVSGAAAIPSAFGGKAHTCYSLDVTLRFIKSQSGGSSSLEERSEGGGGALRNSLNSLNMQFSLLRRFSDVKALHAALKVEFARSATKIPDLLDTKGAFQSGSLGGSKSVEQGSRNIKLIGERSLSLSKYFSQLCTLPQVVTSQPFQSFFEMHSIESNAQCCFMLRSAGIEWRSRWQSQFASYNAKKKKIRFLQMQNGKEKRNQQAELTATKSLMLMHASAAAAAQSRCEAAEAQVRQMKLLLQESDARAASSGNAQGQPLMVTPSNQIQSTSGSTSLIQSPHTDSTISIGLSPPTSKHCSSNPDMRLHLPHPHDICDLVIQGAMQVVEDSSPGGVGAGKHTEYAVHVHLYCGLSYSVSRRYNAFLSLDQQLQKLFPGISLPELPSRSLFSTSILDEMDSRCAALNRYVKGLVRDPLVNSSPLHKFLELNSVQQILGVVDQATYEW